MTTEFLTPKQLAVKLNVQVSTILRWARHGRIPSIKATARCIRFDSVAVDNALGQPIKQ